MDDQENENQEITEKVQPQPQFHSPPEKFWHRGEPMGLAVKLADFTPREWKIIVSLTCTFFILFIIAMTLAVYGVKALTKSEMEKDYLKSGFVNADELIRQGGFVYQEKIWAVGESSIMTIPAKVQTDLKETISANKRLRKKVLDLETDIDFERTRNKRTITPRVQ